VNTFLSSALVMPGLTFSIFCIAWATHSE
jgi:hypothetical protein